MAIDFESLLSNEQKRQLIQSRIAQFAAEAYQYSLNKKTADDLGSEEQAEAAQNAMDVLEAAIKVHNEELDKLPVTE